MAINTYKSWIARLRLFIVLMLVPGISFAAQTHMNSLYSDFRSVTQGWYNVLFDDALGIFAVLFAIEFTWLVVTWMITGKGLHEMYSSFLKKMITIGFFYTILLYAGTWAPMLIGAFTSAAQQAGGVPVLSPTAIADSAVKAFVTCVAAGPESAAHAAGSAWNEIWSGNFTGAFDALGNAASAELGTVTGVDLIVGAIVGLIVFISLVYVALEFFAIQLEAMIIFSVGVIMLGFGAARWTSDFAKNYMKYAFAVGIRLLIITLWAGFIELNLIPLIKTTLISGQASLQSYGIAMLLAILAAWLTKKLPGLANSIMSGGSSLSGGDLFGMARGAALMAVAGAAGLGIGAAAAGGAGAAGAAGGAAGGGAGAAGGSAGGVMGTAQAASLGTQAAGPAGASSGGGYSMFGKGPTSSVLPPSQPAAPVSGNTAKNKVQAPPPYRRSGLHTARDVVMTTEYAKNAFRGENPTTVQAPNINVGHNQ